MIESEDDVRAWVREASGGKARWVEPALGSTPGLPDCWVPWSFLTPKGLIDQTVHLELKCGRIKRGSPILTYHVRPEQRREIIAMRDDRVPVGFLIGVKGTRALIFALPEPFVLNGQWSLDDPDMVGKWIEVVPAASDSIRTGVNFIFSNLPKVDG